MKSRGEKLGRDLNEHAFVYSFGERRLQAGIRFTRGLASGTITLFQQAFAENLVAKFGVTRNKETPMAVGVKLEEIDARELDVNEPFRSLVGHLMWLANQTRPDILNAVRAVARYSHASTFVH